MIGDNAPPPPDWKPEPHADPFDWGIKLTPSEFEWLLEELDRPPQSNPRLVTLFCAAWFIKVSLCSPTMSPCSPSTRRSWSTRHILPQCLLNNRGPRDAFPRSLLAYRFPERVLNPDRAVRVIGAGFVRHRRIPHSRTSRDRSRTSSDERAVRSKSRRMAGSHRRPCSGQGRMVGHSSSAPTLTGDALATPTADRLAVAVICPDVQRPTGAQAAA